MDEGAHEPKISLPEAIFVGSWIMLIDAIEMIPILNFLGDFGITDALAFPATTIYFFMKGVPPLFGLAGNVLELFPILGWLPLRTLGFILTIVADHNPKLQKVAEVADVATGRRTLTQETEVVEKVGVEEAARVGGAATATERAAATGAGATEGVAEGSGEISAKTKEISDEAFGVPKEPWEKVKEFTESVAEQQPAKPKEEEYNNKEEVVSPNDNVVEGRFGGTKNKDEVEADDNKNELNLAA